MELDCLETGNQSQNDKTEQGEDFSCSIFTAVTPPREDNEFSDQESTTTTGWSTCCDRSQENPHYAQDEDGCEPNHSIYDTETPPRTDVEYGDTTSTEFARPSTFETVPSEYQGQFRFSAPIAVARPTNLDLKENTDNNTFNEEEDTTRISPPAPTIACIPLSELTNYFQPSSCHPQLAKSYSLLCAHGSAHSGVICLRRCGARLLCGDICEGSCFTCCQGRIHVPCTAPCGKELVCGHKCPVPCKSYCPPCTMRCETACSHGSCDKTCGEPCDSCQEPCGQQCPHRLCTKLCHEPCDQDLCNVHCSLTLPCGHLCVGVCGELCPSCKYCFPQLFMPQCVLEENPFARFYRLLPCDHCIEVNYLRQWFLQQDSLVSKCPKCKAKVTNVHQFNEVKGTFKTLQYMKATSFGNTFQIQNTKRKLIKKMAHHGLFDGFKSKNLNTSEEGYDINLSIMLKNVGILKKYLQSDIAVCENTLSVLVFQLDCYKTMIRLMKKNWFVFDQEGQNELVVKASFLINLMICIIPHFRNQQFENFTYELNRFVDLIKFKSLCCGLGYQLTKDNPDVEHWWCVISSSLTSCDSYHNHVRCVVETALREFKREIMRNSNITPDDHAKDMAARKQAYEGRRSKMQSLTCRYDHVFIFEVKDSNCHDAVCPLCYCHVPLRPRLLSSKKRRKLQELVDLTVDSNENSESEQYYHKKLNSTRRLKKIKLVRRKPMVNEEIEKTQDLNDHDLSFLEDTMEAQYECTYVDEPESPALTTSEDDYSEDNEKTSSSPVKRDYSISDLLSPKKIWKADYQCDRQSGDPSSVNSFTRALNRYKVLRAENRKNKRKIKGSSSKHKTPPVIDLTGARGPVLVDLTSEEVAGEDVDVVEVEPEDEEASLRSYALPCQHDPSQFVDGICQMPCGAELLCGDVCSGTCHSCSQGRIHTPCTVPCGKTLICGHLCNAPCKDFCPPCAQPCTRKCPHARCQMICGVPCLPCWFPCEWRCIHLACTKLCFDVCDRGLCPEPCYEPLSCGHLCVGVCGETCPPCKTCQPLLFQPIFYYEEEDDRKAKYIMLDPCKHCVEVRVLLRWLSTSPEKVKPKTCPRCTAIITNCQHLQEVKSTLNTIGDIKLQEFGTGVELLNLEREIKFKMEGLFSDSVWIFSNSRARMLKEYCASKCLNKSTLAAMKYILDLMQNISFVVTKFSNSYDRTLRKEMKSHVKFIVDKMVMCLMAFGKQQYHDFFLETDRFTHLAQLRYLCSNPGYYLNKDTTNIKECFEKVNQILMSPQPYITDLKNEVERRLELFRKNINAAPHISEEEKEMMKVNFPEFFIGNRAQRNFYKCSEGHFYIIDGCGGAVETSLCPTCKEVIGGSQHKLVSSSSVAHEMFQQPTDRPTRPLIERLYALRACIDATVEWNRNRLLTFNSGVTQPQKGSEDDTRHSPQVIGPLNLSTKNTSEFEEEMFNIPAMTGRSQERANQQTEHQTNFDNDNIMSWKPLPAPPSFVPGLHSSVWRKVSSPSSTVTSSNIFTASRVQDGEQTIADAPTYIDDAPSLPVYLNISPTPAARQMVPATAVVVPPPLPYDPVANTTYPLPSLIAGHDMNMGGQWYPNSLSGPTQQDENDPLPYDLVQFVMGPE